MSDRNFEGEYSKGFKFPLQGSQYQATSDSPITLRIIGKLIHDDDIINNGDKKMKYADKHSYKKYKGCFGFIRWTVDIALKLISLVIILTIITFIGVKLW
jgi:hypothetical protein